MPPTLTQGPETNKPQLTIPRTRRCNEFSGKPDQQTANARDVAQRLTRNQCVRASKGFLAALP
jgi:hypothetical protein